MRRESLFEKLRREQTELGSSRATPWEPGPGRLTIGGCYAAFPRGIVGDGAAGDAVWAAAAAMRGRRLLDAAVAAGAAEAAYRPGYFFLRAGSALLAAFAGLSRRPDVLLVNGTGRDHPRRAGLAVHIGALLDIPTVGVTHRPLCANGAWPPAERGAIAALRLDGEIVGYWLRTQAGARPLAVHAAWRTPPDAAVRIVLACAGRFRTPAPLRAARRAARRARWEATTVESGGP